MVEENQLMKLCRISGFQLASEKDKILSDMKEIIGIMDRIKEFNGETEYISSACSLKELREDKAVDNSLELSRDIAVGRVVQNED